MFLCIFRNWFGDGIKLLLINLFSAPTLIWIQNVVSHGFLKNHGLVEWEMLFECAIDYYHFGIYYFIKHQSMANPRWDLFGTIIPRYVFVRFRTSLYNLSWFVGNWHVWHWNWIYGWWLAFDLGGYGRRKTRSWNLFPAGQLVQTWWSWKCL